jgi:hypothetical protein
VQRHNVTFTAGIKDFFFWENGFVALYHSHGNFRFFPWLFHSGKGLIFLCLKVGKRRNKGPSFVPSFSLWKSSQLPLKERHRKSCTFTQNFTVLGKFSWQRYNILQSPFSGQKSI